MIMSQRIISQRLKLNSIDPDSIKKMLILFQLNIAPLVLLLPSINVDRIYNKLTQSNSSDH